MVITICLLQSPKIREIRQDAKELRGLFAEQFSSDIRQAAGADHGDRMRVMYLLTGLTSNTAFFNGYTFVNLFQNSARAGNRGDWDDVCDSHGGDRSFGGIDRGMDGAVAATLMHWPEKGQWDFFMGGTRTWRWRRWWSGDGDGGGDGLHGAPSGDRSFLITLAFLFLYRGGRWW